ncbi:glycine betaine ABC transporter substrate-binding protein [Oceanobacillus sp. J11TS1]|uniref:glycine betaine ABC transporter substrate-binding protein n=1 Tax=Oceanobacillus sp. J11TS1 TaxID=2807191 RepID=UPI001BB30796|nr:glycine betaine ABC transporter substrate-binding protein [Oceanobacillus sp. J11TS1]
MTRYLIAFLTDVDVAVVFESVASGDVDATLAAWMPVTHKEFYENLKDNFIDLDPNLKGAKIGIVVPDRAKSLKSSN